MAEVLEKWAEEMGINSSLKHAKKNSLSLGSYRKLSKGQIATIWKFVTKHVKPVNEVKKIRLNLELNGMSVNPSQDLIMVERDMLQKEKANLTSRIENATVALQPVQRDTSLLSEDKRNTAQELMEVQRQSSDHRQSACLLKEFAQNARSLTNKYSQQINRMQNILALRHKTPRVNKEIETIYFTRDTGDYAANPVLETELMRSLREICEAIQSSLLTHDAINNSGPESFFNRRRNLLYKNIVTLLEENSVCDVLKCLNGLQHGRMNALRTASEKLEFSNDAQNLQFRYLPHSSNSYSLQDLQSDPDVFRDIRTSICVKFMEWQKINLSIKTMSARYSFIKDELQLHLEKAFSADLGNLKLARQVVESQLEKEFAKGFTEELEAFRKNLTEEIARDRENQQVRMSKYEEINDMQNTIIKKQDTIRTLFACITEYNSKLENKIQLILEFIATNIRHSPEKLQALQNCLSSEVELFGSLPLSTLILTQADGQVFLSTDLDNSERMLYGQSKTGLYKALGLIGNMPPEKCLPELVSLRKRAFQTQQILQSQADLLDKLSRSYSRSVTEAECRFTPESLAELKKKLQNNWKQRTLSCGLKQQHVLLDSGFKACQELGNVIDIWWELPAGNIILALTFAGRDLKQYKESLIAGNS